MSEIGEIIATPTPHSSENEKCPFCPEEKPSEYKTYPGQANDSKVLGDVLEKPSRFESLQKGVRPKVSQEKREADAVFTDEEEGAYSCEAHHLISGKQALGASGHSFERWIVAGSTIERDTGYSVNNADNGVWAPSIPEKYKGGNWGSMSFPEKLAIARKPMEKGMPQFHKGHHAISDPDEIHGKYDDYLKGMLKAMDELMHGWAQKCPFCDEGKKEKFQPNVRVNEALDNLSRVMLRKINPPLEQWEIFLSKYALEVHKSICHH